MSSPLIIFDCDGVLVDSEPISIGLMREYCRKAGFELTEAQAYSEFLGRPVADAHRSVRATFGHEMEPINLLDFQLEVLDQFRRHLKPVVGVGAALAALEASVCVASSSNMQRIRESLELTELSQYFQSRLFSTDMVARGKPHPDVFLHAASVMGFEPATTIVVEDSPAGISAAKSANMKCIAFCGGSHAGPADLSNRLKDLAPDILIEKMTELEGAIRDLSR